MSVENDTPSIAVSRAAASAAGGRPAVGWAPAAALLVFGLPFAAFSSLILYHFYVKGSFLFDSGLFAFLMSQTDPTLPMPAVFGGGSYLAVHFAPIFILLSLIRRLLPFCSDVQFFAGVIGCCHALPGLAVFWLLHAEFGLRTPIGVAIAAIVGIAFSFNGLALGIVRYPHFEILIPGAVMLFIVALIRQRLVFAALSFGVALATREDAGFHVFAILFLVIALNRWYGTSWQAQKTEIAFAAIAFFYSLTILGLQHALVPGQSAFARVYIGDPPFGKLTPAIVGERLVGYVIYRTYIILPAMIAVWWAVRARNPYIALGYVAFLPWAIVHLIAESDIAGTLSSYYAFPFLVASFWPLAGIVAARRAAVPGKPVAASVLAFSAMVAGSFTALPQQHNPGHIDFPLAFFSPPSLARQTMTERAIAELSRSKDLLAPVLVDGSVHALAPDRYDRAETLWGAGAGGHPNTVIYFVDGYESEAARKLAAAAGLDRHYRFPGTSIRLATDLAIPASAPLAAYLAPADAAE